LKVRVKFKCRDEQPAMHATTGLRARSQQVVDPLGYFFATSTGGDFICSGVSKPTLSSWGMPFGVAPRISPARRREANSVCWDQNNLFITLLWSATNNLTILLSFQEPTNLRE
jgi:hypothetical protein